MTNHSVSHANAPRVCLIDEYLSTLHPLVSPSPTQSYCGRQARRERAWMSASGRLLRAELDSNMLARSSVMLGGGGCV